MKKKYLYSSAAVVLLGLGAYGWQTSQQGLSSHPSHLTKKKQPSKAQQKVVSQHDKTPDEVSKEEGIAAEQIVVKITDQGYVTSHGDHYHFYNGKVPYDAIISEELILKDPNYDLKKEDIVNEVKDGYIIKVDGTYYLYLKHVGHATNVRSKAEIERQRGVMAADKEEQASSGHSVTNKSRIKAAASGRYTTDDGYVFSPTDVIDDLGDGFLVPHGNHFHFIPKGDLSAGELAAAQSYWNSRHGGGTSQPSRRADSTTTVVSSNDVANHPVLPSSHFSNHSTPAIPKQVAPKPLYDSLLEELYATPSHSRYTEADGLVFDPAKITKRTSSGVVVPHGDHYHFIPYSRMSALERQLAQMTPEKSRPKKPEAKPKKSEAKPKKPEAKPTETRRQSQPEHTFFGKEEPSSSGHSVTNKGHIKGAASGRYTTDDGYVFRPTDVIDDLGDGFLIPHGNHFHFIPKGDLSAGELAAAQSYWNSRHGGGTSQPSRRADSTTTVVSSNDVANHPVLPSSHFSNHSTPAIPKQVAPKPLYDSLLEELYATPSHSRYTEADGLVFDPAKITKRTSSGVVVPHGDHYHFIPYSRMSALERQLAQMTPEKSRPKKPEAKPTETRRQSQPEHTFFGKVIEATAKGKDGKAYTTSDGYTFTPESILSYDANGLITKHGDHQHYILLEELDSKELAQAEAYIKAHKLSKVETSRFTPEEIAAKLQYISLESSVPLEDLKVTGDKVIIPHGDHSHTEDLANYPSKLTKATAGSEEAYRTLLMQLKMGYLKLTNGVRDVYRENDHVIVTYKDGHLDTLNLADIHLPLDYEEVEYSSMKTEPSPHQAKIDYIAKQYGVGRGEVFIVDDHTATVNWMTTINLDLVNVNDPIIYTLREDDNSSDDSTETPTDDQPKVDLMHLNIEKSAKGKDGKAYTTSDGYTFSADSILSYDDQGLIAKHGEHEHYIFYHELDDNELQAAQDFINGKHVDKVAHSTFTKEELEAKLRYLSLRHGIPVSRFEVTGNQAILAHGDHSHTVDLTTIPTHLAPGSGEDAAEEYRTLLMQLKLGKLRLEENVRDVSRLGDKAIVTYQDGSRKEHQLSDISLPLTYEETTYDSLAKDVTERDLKLDYIAKQYGLGIGELKPNPFQRHLVFAGKDWVDLNKVDTSAPVIYTKQGKAEEPKADKVSETVETEKEPSAVTPETAKPAVSAEDAQLDSALYYIRLYYGSHLSDVVKQDDQVMLIFASGASLTLTKEEAITAYKNRTGLPAEPTVAAPAEVADEQPASQPSAHPESSVPAADAEEEDGVSEATSDPEEKPETAEAS